MLPNRLGFDHPGYLWLLLALPILWWIGYESLGALGKWRRVMTLLFRSAVWTAIVFAIAGVQMVRVTDRVTVMYLLDQSESIPQAKRQVMLEYVVDNVRRHRNRTREDRAGIVVFGRDAAIEIPPFEDNIPPLRRLESLKSRADATNLESAINLAKASMPEDSARRMVIVTDGNENIGAVRELAARVARSGIGIDVVPVMLDSTSEVLVEKVDLPSNIRKGQPFEARVVLNNYADAGNADAVRGRLRVKQKVGGDETLLIEESVKLDPGKNVFPLKHQIEQPAGYIYEAEFIPETGKDDAIAQNNSATAYTYVRGKGRVLLIEDAQQEGSFDLMIKALRDANIEVVRQPNNELFGSLAELQAYDAVILAGVPRVSGGADQISSFTDDQIEMLVRNTQQLGAGLLMIGGPEGFGAGGWTGTKIEEAMPVDFKIKNSKVRAVGALALIMHASEMPQGNYWQKVIAKAAIEQLGPADYAGVLHWTTRGDSWMWGGKTGLLPVGENRRAMLSRVGRMTPGDMPQFDPAMKMAVAGLSRLKAASVKHCVIISDGDPTPPAQATISAFKNNKITVSTVAVASHGLTESRRLQQIASATGGKYHKVSSGRALPRIFQLEARRVAKPLVYEPDGGAVPEVVFPHALLDGVDRVLPRINGFVLTQTKDSPLAQVLIQSPKPDSPENATVLAVWNYGLGRTAVLTTDGGARWAKDWASWDGYDQFYAQLVRWLMRPTGDTGKFTIATQFRDGQVEVVVNALSQDDSYLNFLDMNATALGPDLKPLELRMRQTAPGRYVGAFNADQSGSYFVNVIPGPGASPLTTGVTVPYSDEYRVREANVALMQSLVKLQPAGGQAGVMTVPLEINPSEELVDTNAFRGGLPKARSIRDAWAWFVLIGSVTFLGDVFVRRVSINFRWVGKAIRAIRGDDKAKTTETTARLDALRKSKDDVDQSLQKRRASVRFEPTAETAIEEVDLDQPAGTPPRPKKDASDVSSSKPAEKSYTERLLEAKRKAKK